MKQKHEPMFPEYDEDTEPITQYHSPPQKTKRKAMARRSPLGKNLLILLLLCSALYVSPYILESLFHINSGEFDLGNVQPRGCYIGLGADRASEMDVSVIIHGNRRNEVTVDIIPPGQRRALQVDRQYHKRFIDTDELFIYQTYAWNTEWKPGSYTVNYDLRGQPTTSKKLYISGSGDHNIYVECN